MSSNPDAVRSLRDEVLSVLADHHCDYYGLETDIADAIVAATEGRTSVGIATPYPEHMDADLRAILGRPSFTCGHLAKAFRRFGADIQHKAEEEQAYVIHWMIRLYLQHGSEWAVAGESALKEMRAVALATATPPDSTSAAHLPTSQAPSAIGRSTTPSTSPPPQEQGA